MRHGSRMGSGLLANVNSSSGSLYVIGRPSVCRLSVTFVRPTRAIEIFGNVSTPFGTLAILDPVSYTHLTLPTILRV